MKMGTRFVKISTRKSRLRRAGQGVAVLGTVLGAATSLHALEVSNNGNGTILNLNTELAFGYFSSGEDYSGAGRDRVDWTEGYLKFGVDGETPLSSTVIGYGAVSALYSFTGGEGDASGLTVGNESDIDIEDAVVGLRFKNAFGPDSSLDISVGAQNFAIGDGFLVQGDSLNAGSGLGNNFDRGGAYWLAARKAFRETAILKFDTGSGFRGDIFYLGSETELQGDAKLAGFNLEYGTERLGMIGLTYLNVVDVDTKSLGGAFATRKDLQTYSLRAQGSAGVENLFLSGEIAYQDGDAGGGTPDVEAWAYYVEAGYTFANIPWSPTVGYRYSHFTGDKPGTAKSEGFDPLFYGFSRGFGTWFQGEVAGNFSGPFNTNSTIQMVRLDLQPSDAFSIGARFFDFNADEVGGVDAQEINVFLEIPVNDHLYISPLYGYHHPQDGFAPGADNNHYFQVFAVVTF